CPSRTARPRSRAALGERPWQRERSCFPLAQLRGALARRRFGLGRFRLERGQAEGSALGLIPSPRPLAQLGAIAAVPDASPRQRGIFLGLLDPQGAVALE